MTVTVDINFIRDASKWEETKHPRSKSGSRGGQFTKKGAGETSGAPGKQPKISKERSEGGIPYSEISHPTVIGWNKQVHKAATGQGSPIERAHKVHNIAQAYVNGSVASYANSVLRTMEKLHGLPEKHLGKAAPKGKTPILPNGSAPPAAVKQEPVKQEPAKQEPAKQEPAKQEPAKQEPAKQEPVKQEPVKQEPGGPPELPDHHTPQDINVHSVFTNKNISHEDKKMVMGKYVNIGNAHAAKLLDWLQKNPPKKELVGPPPELPSHAGPITKKFHEKMIGSDLSQEEKVAAAKKQIADHPDPIVIATQHAKEWLKHFGEDVPEPAKPAPAKPEPAKITPASVTLPPADPDVIHARPSERVKKALALAAIAYRPSSAAKGAKKHIPTLEPDFWTNVPINNKESCRKYISTSGSINNALRQGLESASNDVIENVNNIDDLFEHDSAEVKGPIIVTRGEDVPAEHIAKYEKQLAKGVPCRVMKEGFLSTSAAEQPAMTHKNTYFHILLKPGDRALGLYPIAGHLKQENEVLLRHGQTFEVLKIERASAKDGKPTIIHMVTM